jgi:polyhydroxyalkanoate synthesis regulator phasin
MPCGRPRAQAIEATAGQAGFTRERAQQLADELVSAAGRFRETLEDLRPAGSDEIAALRERIDTLEARVKTLEAARTTTPPAHHAGQAPAGRAAAGQPAAASPPPASST